MTESSRKIIPTWRNNESESLYQKVTIEEHKQRVSTGKFSSIFILQSEYYSFDFCGFPQFNQNNHGTRETKGSIFLFFNLIRAKAVPTTYNNNLTANNLFQYTWATSRKQLFKINNITLSLVAINS